MPKKSRKDALLKITMPDGSKWTVPVEAIARHRARHYREEYNNSVEASLAEDTWPLFESDDYEITDWAANNMNWEDVEARAVKADDPGAPDFQEGWVNGEKEIVW